MCTCVYSIIETEITITIIMVLASIYGNKDSKTFNDRPKKSYVFGASKPAKLIN